MWSILWIDPQTLILLWAESHFCSRSKFKCLATHVQMCVNNQSLHWCVQMLDGHRWLLHVWMWLNPFEKWHNATFCDIVTTTEDPWFLHSNIYQHIITLILCRNNSDTTPLIRPQMNINTGKIPPLKGYCFSTPTLNSPSHHMTTNYIWILMLFQTHMLISHSRCWIRGLCCDPT